MSEKTHDSNHEASIGAEPETSGDTLPLHHRCWCRTDPHRPHISNIKESILDLPEMYLLQTKPERPLTLLYSWLLAKESHLMKHAKFYTDRGFDVLRVKLSVFDILFPANGSKVRSRYIRHITDSIMH